MPQNQGDIMGISKLFITAITGLNLISSVAFAGGGGSDDLDYYCSSSDLKYSVSIDVEDSSITVGKAAFVSGPFTGGRSGIVKSYDDSKLVVVAPPTTTLYSITLEISLDEETGKATSLNVVEGYYVQSTDQISCHVI